MFPEMHLQEMKNQNDSRDAEKNKLQFTQYLKGTKMVFPYINTLSNGWLMILGKNTSIHTIPVVLANREEELPGRSRSSYTSFYRFALLQTQLLCCASDG